MIGVSLQIFHRTTSAYDVNGSACVGEQWLVWGGCKHTWQKCRVSALLCSSRSRGNRRQSMVDDMSLASPRSKWSEQSLKTYKSSSTERESVKTNTVVSPLERNNSLLLNDRPKTCAYLPTKLPRHIKNVTSVKLQFCKEYHSKGSTGQEKAL